jgi:hypothetical protein
VTDTIRVWTRKEIEEAAAVEPEGRTMLRVAISPKLLLMLIDWFDERSGERTEILSAYGNPEACELRWFRRDEA